MSLIPDILDIIERTRKGFYVLDNDTGLEILCFERYYRKSGKTVVRCFLRDPDTKRFVRGVKEFSIHFVGIVERCYPNGCRRGKGCSPENNIHIECHQWRHIDVKDYSEIQDMLLDLQEKLDDMYYSCVPCFEEKSNGVFSEPEEVDLLFHTVEEGVDECLMTRC